ncbi:hypothetical protein [Pseudomonas aeruginosa]|uniref:hypothetical protein n=1 Tax=Pseudomonas aeruginosa TaxID=287 RepID=UPI00163DDD78|nr:hypothetical protein [Pseudomonas aeruginosa]
MAPPACRRRCSTTPSTAGWKPSGAGGVQRAAEHFAEPLLAVRDSGRASVGTQPRHIALLDCASRAWSVAFAAALAAHPRIRAISSFDEYGSNSLCLLAARQQRGLELRLIDAPRRRRTAVATARRAVARPRPRPDAAAVAQRGAHRAWRGYRAGGRGRAHPRP